MIEVAAGVLTDAYGRALLMQRLPGTHLAGSWEFPGGKIEFGETIESALARELREELDIEARACEPLISIPWRYREKSIRLHALRVTEWSGGIVAREGHALRWMRLEEIDPERMPAADRPIVTALRLPTRYAISPGDMRDSEAVLAWMQAHSSRNDGSLLQLRAPQADRASVRAILEQTLDASPQLRSLLLLNADVALARELGIGVHLRAGQLCELRERPLPRGVWVGASCHDANELERAAVIDVDFATLSPVRRTASHPDAQPLGWERFAQLAREARLPVYPLGGVGPDDLGRARSAGAQGVAGISAFVRA